MKRRITLFFGSLLCILLAYWVYQLIAGSGSCAPSGKQAEQRYRTANSETTSQPVQAPAEAGPVFLPRDEEGRLQGIYRAESWDKQDDGSYLLIKPNVRIFQTSGRELSVRADRGTVYVEEVANGVNVRRGMLSGNVEIIYDRATDAGPGPITERLEELIRIHLSDVSFDNDMLEMSSDNYVTVFSKEADVTGKGLLVRWNEEPAELRMLKILRGDYMLIKEGTDEFGLVSLPGTDGSQRSQALKIRPLEDDERLTPTDPISGIPSSQPTSREFLGATSSPASTLGVASGKKRKRRNVFRAVFDGNVRVESGDRRIEGADKLALLFEWDSGSLREPLQSKYPATAPGGSDTRPMEEPSDQQPIVISWSGSLILRPESYTAEPSVDRFRVEAEGENLILADGPNDVRCNSFVYQHPDRAGRLVAAKGQDVTMQMADDGQLHCQAVYFDRIRELAELTGPGSISTLASSPPGTASQVTSQPAPRRTISWQDSVTARIGSVPEADAEGATSSRPFLSEAIFRGGVKLIDGATGEFVRGEILHMWMAQDSSGLYPERAVTSGKVLAKVDNSEVVADKLTAHFRRKLPGDDTSERVAFVLTNVIAEGNVRVIDKSNQQASSASADRIAVDMSDPKDRTVILTGSPAKIGQGSHRVAGPEIRIYEAQQRATVIGPGSIQSVTDRDIEGKTLARPRPVNITWSDSVKYNNQLNEAELVGNVNLITGLSSISCRHMNVKFTESPGRDQAAEVKKAKGALSLEVKSFGRGSLAGAEADGEVVVLHQSRDPDGQLTQEMRLTGEHLVYDTQFERIDCTGYGTLLIEDYRPPEPATGRIAETAQAEITGQVQRPWQTIFEWHKMMRLMLDRRVVIMDGDVAMVHHSGSHVVGAEKLNVPDWGTLTDGRTAKLSCDKLMAQFSAPDQGEDQADLQPEGRPSTFDPGSQVGDIELFVATKDVALEDRDYELHGQQLSYLREKGFAILWGNLDGQPVADAYVYSKGRPISSPKFLCHLEQGHVKKVSAMDLTGSGVR